MTVSEVLTGFFSIALAQSPGKPPDFNELHILNCKSFGKASTALIKVLFCIPASLAACRIVFASGTTSPPTQPSNCMAAPIFFNCLSASSKEIGGPALEVGNLK